MKELSLLIHNSNCSKSRGAKEILEAQGVPFETWEYLNTPLSDELLESLPGLLKMNYLQMIRTGEKIFSELELADKSFSQEEWIKILKAHPILLERPIFIYGKKAIIARPPEKVLQII